LIFAGRLLGHQEKVNSRYAFSGRALISVHQRKFCVQSKVTSREVSFKKRLELLHFSNEIVAVNSGASTLHDYDRSRRPLISDGIAHRSYSQSTQDLDAIEFTYPGKPDGDESTAMLEIVHDIAPGASLNPDSPEALRVFAEDISNLTYDDTIYFYPKQTNVTTEFVIERHMQSNALNSTTYNNGRRMVRDSSRKYHLVYESQAFLWFIPQMRTSWRRKAKSIPDEGNEKFKYQNAN